MHKNTPTLTKRTSNHRSRKSHTGRLANHCIQVLGWVFFPSKHTYTHFVAVTTTRSLLLLTNLAYMFLESKYVHAQIICICTSYTYPELHHMYTKC